ncbi:YceD family protein [Natronospira bacteriovora]|uniref:Large ribosomal RNA subunit accumulation protein YceD n=1 Tax=Natronospira bacteriovora TaxID=3069753 RepID=A0ABU0WCR6_9GAMM|nr:YceD family protein [Natronospira sp. AB-CW4]MDQ2070725.1 YceD family protein [Natronospira sp. AB-CW4]
MSVNLSNPVDPERLAEQAQWLEAGLPVARMHRLEPLLACGENGVEATLQADCRVRFYRDESRRLRVEGRVSAVLPLECQRCLEVAPVAVEGEFSLVIVDSEEAADALPAELDPLLRTRRLVDVSGMVEDELIVALPQVARHARIADCGPIAREDALDAGEVEASPVVEEPTARQRPFQVLAGLGKGKGKGKR